MKKILLFVSFVFAHIVLSAQGIKFETKLNLDQVKEEAKTKNKIIFIDCYTTWCGPCKQLDQEVFSLPEVGKAFENFISIKVQIDETDKDSQQIKQWRDDAKKITQKYSVNAFPTLLFVNANGEILNKIVGAVSKNDLLAEADKIFDVKNQYSVMYQMYKDGKREDEFVRRLAIQARDIGRKAEAERIAQTYIKKLRKDSLFTPTNIYFINGFTTRPTDRGFKFFQDHSEMVDSITKGGFKQIYAESKVMGIINEYAIKPYEMNNADWGKIKSETKKYGKWGEMALDVFGRIIIYNQEIKPYINSKDGKADWDLINSNIAKHGQLGKKALEDNYQAVIFLSEIEPQIGSSIRKPNWEEIENSILNFGVEGKEIFLKAKTIYAWNANDIEMLVETGSKYIGEFSSKIKPDWLNDVAWAVVKKSNDRHELSIALSWSEKAINDLPQNPMVIDTYAQILYKLGRVDEAIKFQEKAISLSKNDNNLKITLEKMRSGHQLFTSN